MSVAEVGLVRMPELDAQTTIMKIDGDFRVYRRNRRRVIPPLCRTALADIA
jgi:hypothetical protein